MKLAQILHVFGPQFLWREGPPNLWTCIIKRTQIAITWQSFTAIGRGARRSRGETNNKLEKAAQGKCCPVRTAKYRPTRLVVDAALRRIGKSRHGGHKIANISRNCERI